MGVVAILAFTALPGDRHYLIPLCLAASLVLPLEHMRLMLLAVDHGSADFSRYNLVQLVSALAFPVLITTAWACGIATTESFVLLAVAAPAVGLALALIRRGKGAVRGPAFPAKRVLLWEGRQFALSVVASNLFNRIDTLLIIWLASLTTQGYYAAAIAAANLLIVAPNALALFSFNSGARVKDPPDFRALVVGGTAVVVFQTLTALAFMIALPTLIVIVFGESFRPAISLALALLPAYAIAGFSQVLEGYLRGRDRSMIGVWARVAGGGVMVVCALLLRTSMGVFSIPVGAALGNATCALWIVVVVVGDEWRRKGHGDLSLAATESNP
jgi:O-antigen/teichoic acid export membrane protein